MKNNPSSENLIKELEQQNFELVKQYQELSEYTMMLEDIVIGATAIKILSITEKNKVRMQLRRMKGIVAPLTPNQRKQIQDQLQRMKSGGHIS